MPSPDRTPLTHAAVLGTFGDRPFTIRQAEAAGIGRSRIRAAVRAGRIIRARAGVFVAGIDSSDPLGEIRGALAAFPQAVAGYSSALAVHGLPLPFPEHRDVHLIMSHGRYRRDGSIHVHGSPLTASDITEVAGIRVTSLARTVIDVARTSPLHRSLIPIDAVMRRWCADEAQPGTDVRRVVSDVGVREKARARLIAALKDQTGWQGVRRAGEAIELGDPASESPLESISRGRLHEFAVPRPVCGMPVRGIDGLLYWADMGWEEQRVLGECDGMLKYTDADVLRQEKRRQEALEQAGWTVVRWTWDDIVSHPKQVVARVNRALHESRSHTQTIIPC